ncbi:MAG: SIS domain-containing protein [Firmicutes bacterium]|nr:SIS domain-containing protein [Bacillota bacterium]
MIFGYKEEDLKEKNAIFTAEEIAQQPAVWEKTIDQVKGIRISLSRLVGDVTSDGDFDIILTGAGTSEYVGRALYPALLQKLQGRVHAIGTTDIVASPELFISPERKTLLVSFARSGNSPESVGAVKAADRISEKVKHLFITCNEEGALAKLADEKDNCFSIVLAPETNDRSFAMTSSFTSMYLAALLALTGDFEMDFYETISSAEKFLTKGFRDLAGFVSRNSFSRVVYLGSDVLKGIAQEAALKVLELTAGQMAAIFDTPMGFRHGPKSIVDDETVCVVFLSDDAWTRRYEMDVLKELYRDRKGSKLVAVTASEDEEVGKYCDLMIPMGYRNKAANCQLAPAYIMVAQTMAMLYSIKLEITPDNPCPTGEVNRVVQGVTIYEE